MDDPLFVNSPGKVSIQTLLELMNLLIFVKKIELVSDDGSKSYGYVRYIDASAIWNQDKLTVYS